MSFLQVTPELHQRLFEKYGQVKSLPDDCIGAAIISNHYCGNSLLVVVPPRTLSVNFVGYDNERVETINTPHLAYLIDRYETKLVSIDYEAFLNQKILIKPFRLANVYDCGKICWGNLVYDSKYSAKYLDNYFWSSGFTPDLSQYHHKCDNIEHDCSNNVYHEHEIVGSHNCSSQSLVCHHGMISYQIASDDLRKLIDEIDKVDLCTLQLCGCTCKCDCCENNCNCECCCDIFQEWIESIHEYLESIDDLAYEDWNYKIVEYSTLCKKYVYGKIQNNGKTTYHLITNEDQYNYYFNDEKCSKNRFTEPVELYRDQFKIDLKLSQQQRRYWYDLRDQERSREYELMRSRVHQFLVDHYSSESDELEQYFSLILSSQNNITRIYNEYIRPITTL